MEDYDSCSVESVSKGPEELRLRRGCILVDSGGGPVERHWCSSLGSCWLNGEVWCDVEKYELGYCVRRSVDVSYCQCDLPLAGKGGQKVMGLIGTACLDCGASIAEIPSVGDYWSCHAGAGVCVEKDDIARCGAGNAGIVGECCEGLIRSLHILQIGDRVQDEECENG